MKSFFNIRKENGCRNYAPLVCSGPGTEKTDFCRMAIRKFFDNDTEIGDDDPFKIACAFSTHTIVVPR